ncbi:hypothetical protein ACT3CD_01710 [Geofilum sp. OHC36d9]|uniref:hypothetical protein n=1 Tax=Geofilum sp. OHC36d9 TaxID=3458413 RepID=UPI004034A9E4
MKILRVSIVLMFAIMLLSPVFSNADGFRTDNFQEVVKSEVPVEELPEVITKALADSEWSDWTVSSAVLVKEESASYYQIALVKDDSKKEVKVSPEGKLL